MAATCGAPPGFAAQQWHLASSRGGRDHRDVPIRSWPSYVQSALGFDRDRKARRAVGPNGGGGEAREIRETIQPRIL